MCDFQEDYLWQCLWIELCVQMINLFIWQWCTEPSCGILFWRNNERVMRDISLLFSIAIDEVLLSVDRGRRERAMPEKALHKTIWPAMAQWRNVLGY